MSLGLSSGGCAVENRPLISLVLLLSLVGCSPVKAIVDGDFGGLSGGTIDDDGNTGDVLDTGGTGADSGGDDLSDSDGDSIADVDEDSPTDGTGGSDSDDGVDTDGDGTMDRDDLDSDGDGILDEDEAGDADLGTEPVDTDEDGVPDCASLANGASWRWDGLAGTTTGVSVAFFDNALLVGVQARDSSPRPIHPFEKNTKKYW